MIPTAISLCDMRLAWLAMTQAAMQYHLPCCMVRQALQPSAAAWGHWHEILTAAAAATFEALPSRCSSLTPSHACARSSFLYVVWQAGWFKKHRLQRPAVAVLLLAKREVEGDADAWAKISAQVSFNMSIQLDLMSDS